MSFPEQASSSIQGQIVHCDVPSQATSQVFRTAAPHQRDNQQQHGQQAAYAEGQCQAGTQQEAYHVGWGGQAINAPGGGGRLGTGFGRKGPRNNGCPAAVRGHSSNKGGGYDRQGPDHPPVNGQHGSATYHGGTMGPQHQGMHFGGRGTACGRAGGAPDDVLSTEELTSFLQKLNKRDAVPERALRAALLLDSRALALLLKELSRCGLDARAVFLFDWLRAQPPRMQGRSQCDVYSFTAMISLCMHQQDVERAMELLEDMRQRNVERNVHTYTALMNVCIKSGKLALALDVYASMRAMNCTPNVVTFNSLVDVYGKLGHWDKAIQVIDVMKSEGVEPVLRTYNTLIIACNMCNRPREALGVYHRCLSDGFMPNSTTFNALISAYGKTAQLDKAMGVYHEMLRQNMDRSVITYSSLISACEKAGQCETALQIFAEMQRDGCAPNTVSFNSLLTACAQSGMWQKAGEVFEQMNSANCMPDVVTYTALISAYERGGQWQAALTTFQRMSVQGCKPDGIVYNAVIDTLWGTGITWAQSKALELFRSALQQGLFKQEAVVRKDTRLELNLHAMTAGVAMLSLYSWLQDIKHVVCEKGAGYLSPVLAIVTDMGKASREQGNCIVKEAVNSMMSFWDAPFRPVHDLTYSTVLEARSQELAEWMLGSAFAAQMASLFPISERTQGSDKAAADNEASVAANCISKFASVTSFELSHGLVLPNMSGQYLQQRPTTVSRLLDLSACMLLQDEVVHDAVLLVDRAASTPATAAANSVPLLWVAALTTAARQQGHEEGEALPDHAELERVLGMQPSSIANVEWQLHSLLRGDTSSISAMRCLKIYLERLGYRSLNSPGAYGVAGLAIMLAVESLYDASLLNCRPSVVAAALLYAERRLRGAVPFWPSMLARLTGYSDLSAPELSVAVRVAQRLSRKLVYAQMYRTQLTQLIGSGVGAQGSVAGGGGGGNGGHEVIAAAVGQANGLLLQQHQAQAQPYVVQLSQVQLQQQQHQCEAQQQAAEDFQVAQTMQIRQAIAASQHMYQQQHSLANSSSMPASTSALRRQQEQLLQAQLQGCDDATLEALTQAMQAMTTCVATSQGTSASRASSGSEPGSNGSATGQGTLPAGQADASVPGMAKEEHGLASREASSNSGSLLEVDAWLRSAGMAQSRMDGPRRMDPIHRPA